MASGIFVAVHEFSSCGTQAPEFVGSVVSPWHVGS